MSYVYCTRNIGLAATRDRRCSAFSDVPAVVGASTSFHWWRAERLTRNRY